MLRVEKINYEVNGRKLLKDITFQVRKGEILAILGANGAGKSTLMGVLCGEKKPDSGAVHLNGKALSAYEPAALAKCRALLSQQQQMTLSFSVEEIVLMGRYPHYKNSPKQQDYKIVAETMELCGVSAFAERDFLSLSGGEQQRVHLARILAQVWDNPDALLLLDEPISAFDRILMLKNGRKLFHGTPVEVLAQKEIYTIFSVESNVIMNPRTLKPYVQLEEMDIDLD